MQRLVSESIWMASTSRARPVPYSISSMSSASRSCVARRGRCSDGTRLVELYSWSAGSRGTSLAWRQRPATAATTTGTRARGSTRASSAVPRSRRRSPTCTASVTGISTTSSRATTRTRAPLAATPSGWACAVISATAFPPISCSTTASAKVRRYSSRWSPRTRTCATSTASRPPTAGLPSWSPGDDSTMASRRPSTTASRARARYSAARSRSSTTSTRRWP